MRIVPGRIQIESKSLEVCQWRQAEARQTIILLHEALGSVSYWKDFPARLAASTHCNVIAYARAGHGDSEGPLEPRSASYYQRQIDTVLPRLLEQFGLCEPVLYGHSEGAMIAFLYAAAGNPVRAIITEAPIVIGEKKALRVVDEMERGDAYAELIQKLSRYHRDAPAVFASWVEAVRLHLASEFPPTDYLTRVSCPVLAIQGEHDPYAGPVQGQALEAGLSSLTRVVLPQAGHLPHREQTDAVLEAVASFLGTCC